MAFSLALGVSTDSIKHKSIDVEYDIMDMEGDLAKMQKIVAETTGYWKGEAGEAHRRQYEDRLSEIRQIIARLKTYPERIRMMGDIYVTAEDYNRSVAASLADNVTLF